MTVSATFLVLDPPLDRLAMLIECIRPVVSECVIVVDDRTAAETVATMSAWRDMTLVPFRWVDDFAEARNAALPHAHGDWILHLDPDEMPTAAMLEFMGTDATLYLDRGRYEIHPERNKKIAYSELILGSGPRGADFYDQPKGEVLHLANWVECVRSRQKPNCPAEAGVSAASAAHLANTALRTGQVARWKNA